MSFLSYYFPNGFYRIEQLEVTIKQLIYKGSTLTSESIVMSSSISKEKLINLTIGILGIYTCYFISGVIHEHMIKKPYTNFETGEQSLFEYPLGFLIFPTGFSWLTGWALNYQNPDINPLPQKKVIAASVMVLISTLTYTIAMYVTNYPIVTMFKSCNILSVLLVAMLCSRVTNRDLHLGPKKLITGLFVTIGILAYKLLGADDQATKEDEGNILLGAPLLIVSLLADGFLPDFQAELKSVYRPRPLQMFQQINKWVCILSLVLAIAWKFQILSICEFLYYYPMFAVHMILNAFISTIGQIFIYRMIKQFKQHVVPFLITTRKIGTVLLSILFYGHTTTVFQFVGIALVFISVSVEFFIEINKTAGGDIQVGQQHASTEKNSSSLSDEFSPPAIVEMTAQNEQKQLTS